MSQVLVSEFEMYKHLREFEENFNSLQGNVHNIASAWLLAAFGGIAFSFTLPANSSFPVPGPFLAMIASFLGSVGIYNLWNLGQGVYQNLLRAAFLEGCRMETKNPDLPQIRRLMWSVSKNQGMGARYRLFYFLPIVALSVISLAITLLTWDEKQLAYYSVSLTAIVIALVLAQKIWNSSVSEYQALAEGLNDKTLESWFPEKPDPIAKA